MDTNIMTLWLNAEFLSKDEARALITELQDGAGRPAGISARLLLCQGAARLVCLGTVASNGDPRHPLYVRADQPLEPWP